MRWERIIKAVATPMPSIVYAIIWFALQPIILRTIYNLPALVGWEVKRGITQIVSTVVYVIINVLWLASWYKLTKYLRSKMALKKQQP